MDTTPPRVLLTGATGFLGRACLKWLLDRGCEVHALAPSAPSLKRHGMLSRWSVDLFQPSHVKQVVAAVRPTHLLHVAWMTTPGEYWTSPRNGDWVTASAHLLRQFLRYGGKRIVGVGSCAEYDWTQPQPCHERQTPIGPTSEYGRAKVELSEIMEQLCADSEATCAWARLFFLYGAGAHPARVPGVVLEQLTAGGRVACSAGTQRRDYLHVDDAADALGRLTLGAVTGPVNVGSGTAVSLRELILQTATLIGGQKRIDFGSIAAHDAAPLIQAHVARLQHELNWTPRIDLPAGLARTVAAWMAARDVASMTECPDPATLSMRSDDSGDAGTASSLLQEEATHAAA